MHALMQDGTYLQTGIQAGAAFSESHDKLQGFIGGPSISVAGAGVGITGSGFSVTGWNSGQPGPNEIAAFSPYGGAGERPPSNACALRLSVSARLRWTNAARSKLTRDYRVDSSRCSSSPMTFGSTGAVILAARSVGTGASMLKQFPVGSTVRLTWSDGWAGSMDAMGGQPLLLDNGVVVAPANCGGDYFCLRNPRTGVGLAADGRVFLVTVDGRCSCSVGMTPVQFAKELQSLGAKWAINLDGGGGTTMWVKGQGVVNRPSDSTGERPVTTALVVLPGVDVAEPSPGFLSVSPAPISTPSVDAAAARSAALAAATDPGSTGGLLQAIMDGALGEAPARLPPQERSTLRQFGRANQ